MTDPGHPPRDPIQLGDWIYRPGLRELTRAGEQRRLKPLSDRLLQRLLREPGAVVSREQLIDEVWRRRMVNDEVLSRAIAELRAMLGDDAREPRYIETLAKGGYRLIAAVSVPAVTPVVADRVDVAVPVAAVEAAPGPAHAAGEAPLPAPARRSVRLGWLLAGVLLLAASLAALWRPPLPTASGSVDLLTARQLSADARLELDPRFDPLGRVVYVRRARGSTASELVMVDRDGQAERVLWATQGALRKPEPSPDGSEIAVLHWPAQRCEVWRVAVLDGHASRLSACAVDVVGGLQWVDGGSGLLLTVDPVDAARSAPGLARLDRPSGELLRLTEPALEEGTHVDPRLSPDGRTLAYATLQSGERQLWLADWPDLRDREALLGRPEPVYAHAFAADGASLLVAGDLTLYRALYRVRAGQVPELLGARGASALDVAADGAVVWMQTRFDGEVWLRESAQEEWRTVASSNRFESQPAFSPDGRWLALVSNRGDSEGIVLVDRHSGESTVLRLDPSLRWVRPGFAADGESLVLTAYSGNRTALYRYRIDNGALTPLVEDVDDAFAGVDVGDRLVYRRGADPATRLEQRMHDSGETKSIEVGPVASFRATGRWLVWRSPGQSRLLLAPLDAPQQAREIARLEEAGEAFALVGDALWYAADRALWRQPLPEGAPQRIDTERFPDLMRPSLAVAVDGSVAVARIESSDTDLMIALPAAR